MQTAAPPRGRRSPAVSGRRRPAWPRRLPVRLAALLGLVLAAACGRAPERSTHRGPVVLVTFSGLRADVVGALGGVPGVTPHLDRLIRDERSWSSRAVSTSSWTVPAMASIFTGLQPWSHRALYPQQAQLRPALWTLPEALKEQGYRTFAYNANDWLGERFGYRQGFDFFNEMREGKRALGHLEGLGSERTFVWLHPQPPTPPYRLVASLVPKLAQLMGEEGPDLRLPDRVEAADLESYFDPDRALPEELQRQYWALYLLNVGWADYLLGRYEAALRASGHWDETLLVVTSSHGAEFGEYGQIGDGGSLGRHLIEVPLIVKLPKGLERDLEVADRERVGLARVWATIVDAVGGAPVPAAAPSLFRPRAGASGAGSAEPAAGILSELYLGNGVNRFSWVRGSMQLQCEVPFAPPEPEYYRARLARLRAEAAVPLEEPPAIIFERLRTRFESQPPLAGMAEGRLVLERWQRNDSRRIRDPALEQRLARELEEAWMAFQDD